MDGDADNGLGWHFALDAPNASPGAGAGNAGGRSYTRSVPAPTPSPADAGEAGANPRGGIALYHDGVQPGDEGVGQYGCRSATRQAEVEGSSKKPSTACQPPRTARASSFEKKRLVAMCATLHCTYSTVATENFSKEKARRPLRRNARRTASDRFSPRMLGVLYAA